MAYVRIAMAQANVTVGDLDGNRSLIAKSIRFAEEQGAHLVTFPELAVSGYPPEDLLLKEHFLLDCRRALLRLVPECSDIAALVGFPELAGGKVYNAAALIHQGVVAAVYRKMELPNYGVFDEKRYFFAGNSPLVFSLNGHRFAVTICEDVWVEGSPPEVCLKQERVGAVLNISASPFFAGKHSVRLEALSRFAVNTQTVLFYNNLVGGQDELVFDGGSMVLDRGGVPLSMAKRFEEDMLIHDFERGSPVPLGATGAFPEYGSSCLRLTIQRRPEHCEVVQPSATHTMGETEEVYAALVTGTLDYVRKNGFRKTVVGLSGGIDSALTAAVAVGALGPENVVGVTMPSQYTSDETFTDAGKLAANLGIRLITVPIGSIYQAYMDEIRLMLGEGPPGLEAENLQARIRGNLLMTFSNRFGWLVLTTGNKSETAVGYSTLYGDTAGGFAVIKDVPKVMVYRVAAHVNTLAGREVIPETIIARAPTAELRPDQRDEDSLPPYEILDSILRQYVEEDRAPEEIVRAGFAPETVAEVVRMVDRNEYKRRQAPPGIKITPKAFGRDRRLPITNLYRG